MSSHSDTLTSGLVRDVIPYDRLPWIRPLVAATTHDFSAVAPLFAGDPADPAAWQATIDRVTRQSRPHAAIAEVVQAQLARRHAPARARAAAAELATPGAVAVVTGQQAGVFGGPLYTLLKAVTTIQYARAAQARHGVPVVPVFWVDADDHDWDEIRAAHLLDRDYAPVTVTAGDLPGAGSQPVGALAFDAGIDQVLDDLAARLTPTEFTPAVLDTLRAHYRAGQSPAAACAGWIEALLGSEGLVVFEASDPAAKRFTADVFARELATPGETARLAREAGTRMADGGHTAQVVPGDDVVCLFRVDETGRRPLRCRDGHVTVDGHEWSVDDLRAEMTAHPDRFSPNVLLRPLVQDTIFPTVCYIAGPSELAYHAQLGPVYAAFGIERPLVASRASATLVDAAALRFFDRHPVALEALQPQDESVLNHLLALQMPAEVEAAFTAFETAIAGQASRIGEAAALVDATLAGAAETTVTRMRETLASLHGKVLQASKKKDETLRRQFIRTRNLTFPEGHPQERFLSLTYFVNRYGLDLGTRLIDGLPLPADAHYVVVP